mmetsp:Transcript_2104/g.4196  ORF Transcript_2104/g.4196 Transcript_2104/m.4196 type:complete len:620 (+) Transcript_2104:50-1909(+)
MQGTPRCTPAKPARSRGLSIGEHSRALSQPRSAHSRSQSRSRAQSPASAGSQEDLPPKSPRTRVGGHRAVRNSRDPRPVGDRGFAAQCARNVVELLASRGYGKSVSHEKLLKDPSTKEFFDIFKFLITLLDPQMEVEGKIEDEVPAIMKRLKYPVEVNRSKLQAISGPNTWPQLLAVLDWLGVLVRINDELVEPLSACQLGLQDPADPERDDGDHHLLRTLHENYLQYLSGKDDKSDEERLRQIYEERIAALQGEIARLSEHQEGMEKKLQEFKTEHKHLLELQRAPAQLAVESERLSVGIQAAEMRVQRAEEETARCQAEEGVQKLELEELEQKLAELAEQVEAQPYSKQDIERLRWERQHLREVLQDLRGDSQRAEAEVWELKTQEARRVDAIEKLARQVGEALEALDDLPGEAKVSPKDLQVRVDLSEPSDALAAQDFEGSRGAVHASTASFQEGAQAEEAATQDILDEQRALQEELSERERGCDRLRSRVEQLARMREEYREWSAAHLDDALRTAEATEDEVHALAIDNKAPSLRDAAEIDRLQLQLAVLKEEGAAEKAQLQEQLRREEDRFQEHRRGIQKELTIHVKSADTLGKEVETVLGDGEIRAGAPAGGA